MKKAIEQWQIRAMYAAAGKLGIRGRGDDDELHQLVGAITGKASIRTLSSIEAGQVLAELNRRTTKSVGAAPPKKSRNRPTTPGGVTSEQQAKIWATMYELKSYDKQPNPATLGDRLCGIIKRQFGVDAAPQQPFRWLTCEQGGQLIEMLKQYAYNAGMKHYREENPACETNC